MRIVRESEMAKLEFVNESGEDTQTMYLPEFYYDIFRRILEGNRKRMGRDLAVSKIGDRHIN